MLYHLTKLSALLSTLKLSALKWSAMPALLVAALLTGCTTAHTPQVSHDGLKLVPDTRLGTVYLKPGADMSQYQNVMVADCTVSFRKNWLRDQNTQRVDLNNRVTQDDVDKIKNRLSQSCKEHFSDELAKSARYQLVDTPVSGEPTLLLKPSIIDLDIHAPDVLRAGISRTYTTSAGEMTLFLEAYDAASHAIIARVVDRAKERHTGQLEWTNSVTNQAEANRVLSRWARLLTSGLNEAQATRLP